MAINIIDTNVVFRQFVGISTANDIQLFVKFLGDNIRTICLSIITGVLLAVTHGSDSLAACSNTINGVTFYIINTVAGLNGNRCPRCSVFTGRAGQSNGAVSAIDNDGRAVFTVDANLAVDTVCPCFAEGNIVAQGYRDVTVCRISRGCNILTITYDAQSFTQVTMYRVPTIGREVHALINQGIVHILKVTDVSRISRCIVRRVTVSIDPIRAAGHVGNLIAAVIEAGTRQGYRVTRRRRNGHAIVIDNRSTCCNGAIFT